MSTQDQYGFFGPSYSFADNIPLPGQIGVRNEASFGAILDSVSGVNYYIDTIAFGGPSFFDDHNPTPMGLRYFLNTGMRCSNGATMSEYFDGITRGDSLGTHVQEALASAGLPGLRGLAPGMLENAENALDPRPIFAAVTATGYPVCQQVVCPVGDYSGSVQNAQDATSPYIIDPVQYGVYGQSGPVQTRWVQGYDSTGSPINITKDEFGATPKCYNADGSYMNPPPAGCAATEPAVQQSQGTTPFGLCQVLQPPSAVGAEGFSAKPVDILPIVTAALLIAGVTLWFTGRSR